MLINTGKYWSATGGGDGVWVRDTVVPETYFFIIHRFTFVCIIGTCDVHRLFFFFSLNLFLHIFYNFRIHLFVTFIRLSTQLFCI